jgi:hypothetical protein
LKSQLHPFKSKLEEKFWEALKLSFPKCLVTYETESLPYVLERKYRPDFIIVRPDGTKTYIEIKGYLRPSDRTKLVAVKKGNPSLDLRIIFAQDNKISNSNMRYSDWAKKYRIPFAIGRIPKKWITK